ncbi:MAG: hypothetical protein ACQEQL_06745 [Pseudomonadota bacterium]
MADQGNQKKDIDTGKLTTHWQNRPAEVNLSGAALLKFVHKQMITDGTARESDSYHSDTFTDPKWLLMSLNGWLETVTRDQATDFANEQSYNGFKPDFLESHDARWFACAGPGGQKSAAFNLGFIIETTNEQMKRQPVAFPAPLATSVLTNAITAGQAISPYLDGKKTLKNSDSKNYMREMFSDISDLITCIGTHTGLPEKTITSLKNEMRNPKPLDIDRTFFTDQRSPVLRTAAQFKQFPKTEGNPLRTSLKPGK